MVVCLEPDFGQTPAWQRKRGDYGDSWNYRGSRRLRSAAADHCKSALPGPVELVVPEKLPTSHQTNKARQLRRACMHFSRGIAVSTARLVSAVMMVLDFVPSTTPPIAPGLRQTATNRALLFVPPLIGDFRIPQLSANCYGLMCALDGVPSGIRTRVLTVKG